MPSTSASYKDKGTRTVLRMSSRSGPERESLSSVGRLLASSVCTRHKECDPKTVAVRGAMTMLAAHHCTAPWYGSRNEQHNAPG